MENRISMQMRCYTPTSSNDESSSSANNSSPLRKRRCLNNREQQASTMLAIDSMSHRLIEKRRRDRMNNCLADLAKLIPAEYLKKARGRVEKTEIIEMAIRHMKHLQGLRKNSTLSTVHPEENPEIISHLADSCAAIAADSSVTEHYRLGFQECLSETMHFLIDIEGGFFARDTLYVQLIGHLQRHCENIMTAKDRVSFSHSEIQGSSDCPQNINSDNGSSSGVSSFGATDFSERPSTSTPIVSASVSPTMTISTDDSNSSSGSSSDTPMITATTTTNYKFKSSIKQRFSAERVDSSCRASIQPSPANFNDKQSRGVPIFALHDDGDFYVPLIVESALLKPHLTRMFTNAENRQTDAVQRVDDADIVLHPVTISVNLYQSANAPALPAPTTRTHRLLQ